MRRIRLVSRGPVLRNYPAYDSMRDDEMTTKRKNQKNAIINVIGEKKTLFVSLMEAKFRHYWDSPAYNMLERYLRHCFSPNFQFDLDFHHLQFQFFFNFFLSCGRCFCMQIQSPLCYPATAGSGSRPRRSAKTGRIRRMTFKRNPAPAGDTTI